MKILFIEPDEYYHPHFKQHFEDLGEVVIFKNGAAAKDFLKDAIPDALVMELLLGNLSGYDILDFLQKSGQITDLPVIIFSKLENLEDIKESLGRGVNGYFVKGKDTISDIKKLLLAYAN